MRLVRLVARNETDMGEQTASSPSLARLTRDIGMARGRWWARKPAWAGWDVGSVSFVDVPCVAGSRGGSVPS